MYKIIGILLLIADIVMIPMLLIYYVLYTIDLLYGCANDKGNFKNEFADFNKIVIDNVIYRINEHKERILGD